MPTDKAPDQRFQTAAEVANVLGPYAAGSDLTCVAAQHGVRSQCEGGTQGRRRALRSYWLASIIGLALSLGIIGYWNRGPTSVPPPALRGPEESVSPARLKQIQKETDKVMAEIQADMKDMNKELDQGLHDIDTEHEAPDHGPNDHREQQGQSKPLPGRSPASASPRHLPTINASK